MGRDQICYGCGEVIRFRTIDDKVIPMGCRCSRGSRGSRGSINRRKPRRRRRRGEYIDPFDGGYSIPLIRLSSPWSYLQPQHPDFAIEQFDCAKCRRVHYRLTLGPSSIVVDERGENWSVPECSEDTVREDLKDTRRRIETLNRSFLARNPTASLPDSEGIGCLFTLAAFIAYVWFVLVCPGLHDAKGNLNNLGIIAIVGSVPWAILISAVAGFLLNKWDIYRARKILPPWWPVKFPGHQPTLTYSREAIETSSPRS